MISRRIRDSLMVFVGTGLSVLGICSVWTLGGSPAEADTKIDIVPTVTLTVPGDTVTIRVPGPVRTLPPPPQVTVTATVFPRESRTVYIPGHTRTKYIRTAPTATVTAFVVPPDVREDGNSSKTSSPGQPSPNRGKIGEDESRVISLPPINLGVPEVVGLSLLTILSLLAVVLIGMYAGYVLGYKDSERKDTNFIRALREQMSLRNKNR